MLDMGFWPDVEKIVAATPQTGRQTMLFSATIDRQIRKNKTRLSKRLRQDSLVTDIPAEFDVSEEKEFDVVRTKHVAAKPMSTEEAIMQMNLLDHDFFIFRNMDDVVCIVYRRRNGGYGLIETDGIEEE